MTGKLAFADYFAPAFQHAVPEAQFKTITANLVAQYGQPVAVESASSTDGRQGTVKLRFEKGVGTIALAVGAGPDQRGEGLRIQNRSEERRVGKEGFSTCRYGWSPGT